MTPAPIYMKTNAGGSIDIDTYDLTDEEITILLSVQVEKTLYQLELNLVAYTYGPLLVMKLLQDL